MKKLEFLVLFNLTIGTLCAQPSIQWQHCYGGSEYDEATSVQVCQDSGLVFAGVSQSTDGNVSGAHGFDDFWIIKTNHNGQIIWSKCYGGSNHEKPYSIQQTLDRGFIVAGFTKSSDGDVTGQHGASDAWILKIDSTGQIQWQKCLGGEGHDLAWDICQTKDGGYVFTGQSGEIGGDVTGNNGNFDCWVVKLDSEGALVWQRSIGGGSYDIGYCIQETEDSGFILCGESQSNDGDVSVNFGNSDYWVVKLNFEGKIEWEQSYGGSALDRANEIQQTPDRGFLVFGQSRSVNGQVSGNHGGFDAWLLKVDSIGNLLWQNPLGGTSEDFGRAFIQKEDGNIWALSIVSSNNGDVMGNHGGFDNWITALSSSGSLLWQKTMGGSLDDFGYHLTKVDEDEMVVVGGTRSNNGDVSGNHGSSDYWIVKLSAPSSSTYAPEPVRLVLAPNPAREHIQLLWPPVESGARVRMTDALGRVHIDTRLDAAGVLDVSGLPKGVYWVEAPGAVGRMVKE